MGVQGEKALQVWCPNGAQAALAELIPQCERAAGCVVSPSYCSVNVLRDRTAQDQFADVYVHSAVAIAELEKLGKLRPGSRRDLARCGIGVAVRAGAARPDIASTQAFRRALLEARAIAYAEVGLSGVHFAAIIERLGIAHQVRAKARTKPDGLIGGFVADGEAELAIQFMSELKAVPGLDIVGPLPPELQKINTIAVAIGVTAGAGVVSAELDSAQALLEFLGSAAAAQVFEAKGYEICAKVGAAG